MQAAVIVLRRVWCCFVAYLYLKACAHQISINRALKRLYPSLRQERLHFRPHFRPKFMCYKKLIRQIKKLTFLSQSVSHFISTQVNRNSQKYQTMCCIILEKKIVITIKYRTSSGSKSKALTFFYQSYQNVFFCN